MKILEMQTKLGGEINPKTGLPYALATISRAGGSPSIRVVIVCYKPKDDPQNVLFGNSGSEIHRTVQANDESDIFSMAECLQECLEGYRGSRSEIHVYYRLLQHFMD